MSAKLNPIFSKNPNQMSGNKIWEHYEECLKCHDWTYQYSDDTSYYQRGSTELKYILMIRKGLALRDAVRADELFKTNQPKGC